ATSSWFRFLCQKCSATMGRSAIESNRPANGITDQRGRIWPNVGPPSAPSAPRATMGHTKASSAAATGEMLASRRPIREPIAPAGWSTTSTKPPFRAEEIFYHPRKGPLVGSGSTRRRRGFERLFRRGFPWIGSEGEEVQAVQGVCPVRQGGRLGGRALELRVRPRHAEDDQRTVLRLEV